MLGNAGVKVVLTSDRIGDYVDLRGLLEEARVDQAIYEFGANEAEFYALADDVSEAELDARRIAVRIGSTAMFLYTSRHDVAAARGADQPRVAGAQLDRVRQRLPDASRATTCGRPGRCSTSARSARS